MPAMELATLSRRPDRGGTTTAPWQRAVQENENDLFLWDVGARKMMRADSLRTERV